jgi:hypothetical protein
MGPTIVRIVRDGPKEAVDQILPVGPGRTKEFHNHILYDFQAHKIYTKLMSDPSVPCSVMDYTSPAAPPEFDVITGSADSMKELLQHARQVGTETVNGIPAKVMEATFEQGKETVWIAQNGAFPVKVVMRGPDGKSNTLIELKQLSFAKPPASALAPPAGCTTIQGEATATGAHAEFGGGGSSSKPATNVTALKLEKIPPYTGSCPAHVQMVGAITTDGPGKVYYEFGAGAFDPGETLTFSAAGTKTVTHVMTLQPKYGNQIGGSAILRAIGTDSAGNHGMPTQWSNNADFMVTCNAGEQKPGETPAVPTTSAAVQDRAAAAQVTAVHLEVVPSEYSGPCPLKVRLVGTLTAGGPGTAYYQFQAAAVGANREGALEVHGPGTETVSNEGVVRQTPRVQSVRFLAGMEPRGHQENAKWTDVHLNITCTSSQ